MLFIIIFEACESDIPKIAHVLIPANRVVIWKSTKHCQQTPFGYTVNHFHIYIIKKFNKLRTCITQTENHDSS